MNEIHILIVVDCIVFMRDFIQYTIQEYVQLSSIMKNVIYSNYTHREPALTSKQPYKYHLNILNKKCFIKNRVCYIKIYTTLLLILTEKKIKIQQ